MIKRTEPKEGAVRIEDCRNKHPGSSSYAAFMPARGIYAWVCRDCSREKEHRNPKRLEAKLARLNAYKEKNRAMTHQKGYSVPDDVAERAQCKEDWRNPDWSRKPSPATEYLLATCNGRKGLAACPVKDQCLVWAKGQPQFVGTAGGMMFGTADREESAA